MRSAGWRSLSPVSVSRDGRTALMYAAMIQQVEAVKLLVENKAVLSLRDDS